MTWKFICTVVLVMISSCCLMAQSITLNDWNEEAKTNIRLLPKYGHVKKTQGQKEADAEFIESTLKQDLSRRAGAEKMIVIGFKYLYKDVRTAMYRFNQAYLLDSTNVDIYWGFGGVYMVLGDLKRAGEQYESGLKIAPRNPHLLTDYATYFLMRYNLFSYIFESHASLELDSAMKYLNQSFKQDNTDPNTCYKLSTIYLFRNDCKNAKWYHDRCLSLSANTIDPGFTAELRQRCR